MRFAIRLGLAAGLGLAGLPVAAETAPTPTPAVEPSVAEDAAEAAEGSERKPRKREYVEVNTTNIPRTNTIATKIPLSLQLTPAHIGVIGSELIWERSSQVLTDALTHVSSLNVQPGGGVYDQFYLRGFDSLTGGLLLIDGAPEPEVSFYDLYNVSGIEVIKGPAGFVYGSNPLAGAVNIVRKQPQPGQLLQLSVGAGSYDTYSTSVDWNTSNESGDLAFRLNGTFRESDGYRDGLESRHWAINPAVSWKVGDRHRFNINVEHVVPEYTPDAGIPLIDGIQVADVDRTRNLAVNGDYSDQELQRFQFDYDYRFNDAFLFRTKLFARSLDWNSAGTQLLGATPDMIVNIPGFGDVPVPAQVFGVRTSLDDKQQATGVQFEAVTTFETGPVRHNLLTGWEFSRLTDKFAIGITDFLAGELQADGALSDNPAAGVFFPFQQGDATSDIVAPYVIDQMEFGEKFHLFLGARYDLIKFEDSVQGARRSDSELSPMVGAVFAADPSLSFYVNGGQTFAPPSPRATGGFDPEESTQYEAGVKKQFRDGQMQLTTAVYQIERDNIAIPDDNLITQQIGDQRSRGFELEFAAQAAPTWNLFGSYTYTDAELTRFAEVAPVGQDPMGGTIFGTLDRSGNRPAFAPEHMVSTWVSKDLPRNLGVAGGVRYVGGQFIAEDNRFEIDDVVLVDASVFWNQPSYRVRLNLQNLTDEEYVSRGFGNSAVIPAEKFNASAQIEFRFN